MSKAVVQIVLRSTVSKRKKLKKISQKEKKVCQLQFHLRKILLKKNIKNKKIQNCFLELELEMNLKKRSQKEKKVCQSIFHLSKILLKKNIKKNKKIQNCCQFQTGAPNFSSILVISSFRVPFIFISLQKASKHQNYCLISIPPPIPGSKYLTEECLNDNDNNKMKKKAKQQNFNWSQLANSLNYHVKEIVVFFFCVCKVHLFVICCNYRVHCFFFLLLNGKNETLRLPLLYLLFGISVGI